MFLDYLFANDRNGRRHVQIRRNILCVSQSYVSYSLRSIAACPRCRRDVVHHAFVKIAENIKNIEPVSPKTKQFIVIMIENRVTDIFRTRGKHPVIDYNDELQSHMSAETDGEDLLVECILKLPEQQRTVIWMKYHHGYSLREIAKMLGVSLAWAQKIDQRAKKKLEEIYLEGGGAL